MKVNGESVALDILDTGVTVSDSSPLFSLLSPLYLSIYFSFFPLSFLSFSPCCAWYIYIYWLPPPPPPLPQFVAGQEEFSTMRAQYMHNAAGFILAFAMDSRTSFQYIQALHAQLLSRSPAATCILVATKADLRQRRQVCVRFIGWGYFSLWAGLWIRFVLLSLPLGLSFPLTI